MTNEAPQAFEDRLLKRIPLEIAVAALLLGGAAALLFDPPTGLFVFAGAVSSFAAHVIDGGHIRGAGSGK